MGTLFCHVPIHVPNVPIEPIEEICATARRPTRLIRAIRRRECIKDAALVLALSDPLYRKPVEHAVALGRERPAQPCLL